MDEKLLRHVLQEGHICRMRRAKHSVETVLTLARRASAASLSLMLSSEKRLCRQECVDIQGGIKAVKDTRRDRPPLIWPGGEKCTTSSLLSSFQIGKSHFASRLGRHRVPLTLTTLLRTQVCRTQDRVKGLVCSRSYSYSCRPQNIEWAVNIGTRICKGSRSRRNGMDELESAGR
ncbi:hypothetical protein BKA93DRAFT_258219 [Sparassis latifolia]